MEPAFSFGRGLSPICHVTNSTQTAEVQCTNEALGPDNILLQGASEAYLTLTNSSSSNIVLQFQSENRQFAYLADVRADSKLDFEAETFVIGTTCQSISKACNLRETEYCDMNTNGCSLSVDMQSQQGLIYNCSSNLNGDLATGDSFGLFTRYFARPNYQTELSNFFGTNLPGPSSDWYLATGAVVAASTSLATASDKIHDRHYGNTAFLLGCHVRVYALNYKYVN